MRPILLLLSIVYVLTCKAQPCNDVEACILTNDYGNGDFLFENCSTPVTNAQYVWDFGDGAGTNDYHGEHTYADPGTYTTCLTIYWQNCVDSTCTTIVVEGSSPCDDLNAVFDWTTSPNGTLFSNGTTGTGFQSIWSWTFGDGTTSDDPQPIHMYADPGIYFTCLTVISLYQYQGQVITCVDSICIDVTIEETGICDDVEACMLVNDYGSGTFLFENCSTPITNSQFMWSFGDGTTDNGMIADHVYSQPGTYTVCLTMYWQNCVDSTCTTIVVEGTSPCDELSADFYYSGGVQGMNFGHPNVNLNWTYFWEFGDGTMDYGPSPYHTYPGPGTYETCLTVWTWDPVSQDTCFADHCETIVIDGGPCDFLQACYVPTQTAATSVFFNNCTSNEQGTVFTWLFGDGTTSNEIAPTHTYTNEGSYEVCLVAEWQNCFDSTCTYITVGQGNPCDDFEVFLAWNQGGNDTYFFNATSNLSNTNFTWYFGDNTQATGASVQHVFTDPGSYEVCVLASYYNSNTGDTCLVEDCVYLEVGIGDPCSNLDADFGWTTTPNGTQFSNGTTGTGFQSTWNWTFGDGTTSDNPQPIHMYAEPGIYYTCLTVISQYQYQGQVVTCVDSMCIDVLVDNGTNPCDSLSADFYYSGGVQGMNFGHPNVNLQWTYYWEFGDGTTDYGPSPFHTYPGPGTYQTCLTVWTWDPVNQDTCFADHCETVIVSGNGDPCENLNAEFVFTTTPNGTFFSNVTTGVGFQTTWYWEFGDGSTSDDAQVSHLFAPGTYNVCLTVLSIFETNGGNLITCVDTICNTVTVQGNDPCDLLVACFESTQTSSNVVFFNNCTPNEQGTVYSWYFGDGAESNDVSPVHTFPAGVGVYSVCLIAQWQNCVDSTCTSITVGNTMSCDSFSTWFDVVYGNVAVFFEAQTSQNVDGYVWDFGDGTEGYDSAEIHYFEPPGPYTVCLSTYYWLPNTQDTCWSTHCQTVNPYGANGVADLNAEDLFSIYPQPATDVITIDGATLVTGAVVELFGMDGRLEHQERITALPHQLNVSQLSSAVHLMRIQLDGVRYNYRIVVQ